MNNTLGILTDQVGRLMGLVMMHVLLLGIPRAVAS